MIIFNEKIHAEKILNKGILTPNQEIRDLFIVAKYLIHIGYDEIEIKSQIEKIIQLNNLCYSENVKNGIIRKTIGSAKMGKLIFDKEIEIYENELESIRSLNDINLEKLLFTYLVLSKFANGLFKSSRAEIFRLAKVEAHNRDKPQLIYKLNKTGFATTIVKKGKTLRGVNITPSGDMVMKFIPEDNFILRYLKLILPDKIIECAKCGKLIEKASNRTKYCNVCFKDIRRKQIKINVQNFRSRKCNQLEKP